MDALPRGHSPGCRSHREEVLAMGATLRGSQSVGRVDHVTFAYRSPERLDAARDDFASLLGIDDWEEIDAPDLHLRMLMSWGSGLELMCATGPGSMIDEYLEHHGDGFFGLVIGVADLDDALSRFREHGREPLFVSNATYPHVLARFDSFRSATLGDVGGIRTVLGEYQPKGSAPAGS
jgi:hypothetical protein